MDKLFAARQLNEAYLNNSLEFWFSPGKKRELAVEVSRPLDADDDDYDNRRPRGADVLGEVGGGGAMAHVDGYCSVAMSAQFHGDKVWRYQMLPERV